MRVKRLQAGRILAPAVLLIFLTAAAARADDVTFQFEGEVIGGAPGETITGTYTFDGDASPTPGGFATSTYPLASATVTHGGTDYAFSGGTIQVTDDSTFFFVDDVYQVSSTGMNGSTFKLVLDDPTRSAFSDQSLPTTPPDLADFASGPAVIELNEGLGGGVVTAKITSLTLYEAPSTIEVSIDVKPGSSKNPLNPKSRGKLPVAILGNGDFDVKTVDVSTVGLAVDGGAAASPVKSSFEDVDGDGDLDLVLHFKTQDLGGLPSSGTVDLTLTGRTTGGDDFVGLDTVMIVPGK